MVITMSASVVQIVAESAVKTATRRLPWFRWVLGKVPGILIEGSTRVVPRPLSHLSGSTIMASRSLLCCGHCALSCISAARPSLGQAVPSGSLFGVLGCTCHPPALIGMFAKLFYVFHNALRRMSPLIGANEKAA